MRTFKPKLPRGHRSELNRSKAIRDIHDRSGFTLEMLATKTDTELRCYLRRYPKTAGTTPMQCLRVDKHHARLMA